MKGKAVIDCSSSKKRFEIISLGELVDKYLNKHPYFRWLLDPHYVIFSHVDGGGLPGGFAGTT